MDITQCTRGYKVAFSLRPSTAIECPQSNVNLALKAVECCTCNGRSKNAT